MNRRSIFLALVMFLFVSAPASADVMGTLETWSFTDTSYIFPDWGNGKDDTTDVIGVPDIIGGQAVVENNGGSYTLRSVTLFLTAATNESAYNLLTSGDLFINTGADQTWDNSVSLTGVASGAVAVYDLALAYDAANGYIMSSMPGYTIREDHPIAVDYAALGLTPSDTATFSGLPNWPGAGNVGVLTIAGLAIDFDQLTLGYTVNCANDVLFQQVQPTPIPATVMLLGVGLLGMAGWRRMRS